MALTRSYKETIVRRIREDPEFAEALYAEALSSLVEGDKTTALSILKDLVHARITFKTLAEKIGMGEKSLYRVFGPNGNPTLETLSTILDCIGKELGLKPSVTVTRIHRRRARTTRRLKPSTARPVGAGVGPRLRGPHP